jgi:hypothetical protein
MAMKIFSKNKGDLTQTAFNIKGGVLIKKTENSIASIPLKKVLYVSFALTLISISAVLVFQQSLPPEVPLFYGLPEGDGQLTSSKGLVIPSLLSLAILAVNTTVSFFTKNAFLKKTLIIAVFATSFFLTVTTFKILFLVGSF